MFLNCETRCDITFVIEQLSHHNLDLYASHLHIAKQVLRYFKDMNSLGIE